MRCVVVDDEELQVSLCKMLIQEHTNLKLEGTFRSALDALKFIRSNPNIDLIFLDIMLPDITGFELLSLMKDSPQVILMSSAKEYAIEAFDFDHVLDYLLKPLKKSRFLKAVNKAIGKREQQMALASKGQKSFYVQSDKRLIKINPNEIDFVEACGNYVFIHLETEKIFTYCSLKKVSEKLAAQNFVQTHRSYIINIDKIKDIEDNSALIGNKVIPISRRFRKNVLSSIDVL
ncbi:LytR/AlgR family response regulator transcription factor [Zunongwangia atlantica 22II14-10F7]|uniref:Two-component response transcriptional regulator n=2 Tax=Zunongwangia TaxID=417127 RepID=A0A1Y1T377_9FLAO|nr:two-component response transcriptional regulator [Zunongwangia atlantica 22II14-10F7]